MYVQKHMDRNEMIDGSNRDGWHTDDESSDDYSPTRDGTWRREGGWARTGLGTMRGAEGEKRTETTPN